MRVPFRVRNTTWRKQQVLDPVGKGPIRSLSSGCLSVWMSRKSTLSIFSRLAPTIFFKLGTMKGDINTYQMLKVPCRLMHWVTLFGPFLGPNLPKNRHFVNFLENGSYDFFKTWNKDGGHQYLSNGENPIVIDSFPREL